tara:strand:- start:5 stop:112 length:108 start_codon:yes stop_codon:yes gene_type:complete
LIEKINIYICNPLKAGFFLKKAQADVAQLARAADL